MSQHTYVVFHAVDGKNKKTRFAYESLDPDPSDSDINSLVAAFKLISRLGVEAVTVSKHLAGFTPIPADDVDARVADTATLKAHKGAAFGGTYSFEFAAVKSALIDNNGNLIVSNAAFTDWCEWFDDGSGIGGLQGPFTISDGEQLAENGSDPTLPSGLTPISGATKRSRR